MNVIENIYVTMSRKSYQNVKDEEKKGSIILVYLTVKNEEYCVLKLL